MAEPLSNIVNIVSEKTCTKCGVLKNFSEFWKETREKSGYANQCKKCCEIRRNNYLQKNPSVKKKWRQNSKLKQKITPDFIICTTCKESKPNTSFGKNSHTATGKNLYCKECLSNYTYKRYHENDEVRKAIIKRAAQRNRKSIYGISKETFNSILIAQNNKCAICTVNLDSSKKSLIPQMDHCHTSGTIRGILCVKCNLALGGFQDREDILISAAQYLSKYRGK